MAKKAKKKVKRKTARKKAATRRGTTSRKKDEPVAEYGHYLKQMMQIRAFEDKVFELLGRDVLKGADFVVLTFADRGVHFRGVDCEVSKKYGVYMCSGDTIGPGGIFRSLREIPKALAVAKDVRRLAPKAWLINYINPTAVLGIALEGNVHAADAGGDAVQGEGEQVAVQVLDRTQLAFCTHYVYSSIGIGVGVSRC